MLKNWKDVQNTEEWVEIIGESFQVTDWAFCTWLKNEKKLNILEINNKKYLKSNIENLRNEYNKLWIDVDKDFGEESWLDITYQQEWEEAGLTYKDAQEWIPVGFKPKDDYWVKNWKSYAFTPQEVKSWIEIGLNNTIDDTFAAYLRVKIGNPQPNLNLEQLREEYRSLTNSKIRPVQKYLDAIYLKSLRNAIKELYLYNENFTGVLDLSDFVNLEKLDCRGNQLTSLNLDNCHELIYLDCEDNQLTTLDLSNCANLKGKVNCANNDINQINLPKGERLESLNLSNNKLNQDLSIFSELEDLEELIISNNPITGSLKSLENLKKLRYLYISDTDIDSGGLEHLPESIKIFRCSADKKKDAKVKTIEEKLKKYFDNKIENYQNWKNSFKDTLTRTEEIKKDIHQFFGGYSDQEIKNLKDPEQLGKWGYAITAGQWIGRGLSATGGVLVIKGAGDYGNDYTINGGVLAVIGPFVEALASYYEKKYYEKNENKWDRFITDSKNLWNDYQELKGFINYCAFLAQETNSPLKEKKEMFESLRKEIQEFNKEEKQDNFFIKGFKLMKEKIWDLYCNTDSGFLQFILVLFLSNEEEGDILVTKNKFAQDLQKNWADKEEWDNKIRKQITIKGRKTQWKEIRESLTKLSSREYQELFNGQIKSLDNAQKLNNQFNNIQPQTKSHHVIKIDEDVIVDLDKYFEVKDKLEQEQVENEELITQIETPPKN